MRCFLWPILCLVIIFSAMPLQGQEKSGRTTRYVEVAKYDPNRNAEKDLADALAEAKRAGKRLLLAVGVDWCEWCHALDNFYAQNLEILAFRKRNYVHVKIAFAPQSIQVLSRFPPIPGYPHFFILESSGQLLHSQDTTELELGKSYDTAKFSAFLKKWAPYSKTKKQ